MRKTTKRFQYTHNKLCTPDREAAIEEERERVGREEYIKKKTA